MEFVLFYNFPKTGKWVPKWVNEYRCSYTLQQNVPVMFRCGEVGEWRRLIFKYQISNFCVKQRELVLVTWAIWRFSGLLLE